MSDVVVTPTKNDTFTIIKGDDWTRSFQCFYADGITPVSIVGASFDCAIRYRDNRTATLLASPGVTITDGANGIGAIALTSEETALLQFSSGYLSLRIILGGDERTIINEPVQCKEGTV